MPGLKPAPGPAKPDPDVRSMTGIRLLEARFKRLKPPLKLPLLRCFRVRREEGRAWRRRLALARHIAAAVRGEARVAAFVGPQACAREKAVLDAVTHQLLEVGVLRREARLGSVPARQPPSLARPRSQAGRSWQ